MRNFIIKVFCFSLNLLILVTALPFLSSAGHKENITPTIRVGYYESPNFQNGASADEPKSGYSYEYLQKIAYYTGWNYEYVYGDWSDLYSAFLNGEIDLMAGISKTSKREKQMLFPNEEMGSENYYLYSHESNQADTSSLSFINGKRIGVIRNNLMTQCLEAFISERHLTPKLVYYNGFAARDKAFHNHKIDYIVSTDNNATYEGNLHPIIKIGESPYYLAISNNRPELLHKLNTALDSIHSGGYYFNQALQKTYFNNAVHPSLTPDESLWVSTHSSLTVGYLDDYLPFCGTDAKGKPTGIITNLFSEMLHRLQLSDRIHIKYVSYENQHDLYQDVTAGQIDVAFPIYADIWISEQNNLFQTDSFADAGADIVFTGTYNKRDLKSIAINKNNLMMTQYVQLYYPTSKLKYYNSIEDCLVAVQAGEADCTLLNGYRTTGLLRNRKYDSLNNTALPKQFSLGMGVQEGNSPLVSLLNHGLRLLDDDYVYLHTYQYGVNQSSQSVADFFHEYALPITLSFIALLMLVIFSILITGMYGKAKIAERNMKEATITKESVLSSLGAASWSMHCHKDGTLTDFQNSEELRKMLGYTAEEYADDYEFALKHIHPDDWDNIVREDKKVCNDFSETFDTEWRVRTKTGEYKWFRAVGRVAEGTDGLFYGALLDINNRKKAELIAEESNTVREQLQEAMDSVYRSLGSAPWQHDYDEHGNHIRFLYSDEFIKLHGFSSHAEAPSTVEEWLTYVHPDDLARVTDTFLQSDKQMVYRARMKNGEYRFLKASSHATYREDGTLKHIYGAIMDVHEQEIARLELEKAMEMAESANKAKTAFLFNMSHDIRTPMNAIIGFAELMQAHWDNREISAVYLTKLKSASQFLLALINNVLEMARIESGKATLNESACDLHALVHDVCNVFEDAMRKRNITFNKEFGQTPKYIYADATKVREIILNILSNALKYTRDGGTITYSIQELPGNTPDEILLESAIRDNGIGMSEEFLPHVFEEFSREKTETENHIVGTGLGMPIVKQLVELMNGTITVESVLGEGSTFTVRIPHRIANAPAVSDNIPDITPDYESLFSGKRILLAEDNPLNAEIAGHILKDKGFEVDHVENGALCVKAIENAPAFYYDLILMDVQMPELNGYEATKAIRSLPDEAKSSITILAMTANAFEEDKQTALQAGMNGHLVKPINVKTMLNTLAKVLQ